MSVAGGWSAVVGSAATGHARGDSGGRGAGRGGRGAGCDGKPRWLRGLELAAVAAGLAAGLARQGRRRAGSDEGVARGGESRRRWSAEMLLVAGKEGAARGGEVG